MKLLTLLALMEFAHIGLIRSSASYCVNGVIGESTSNSISALPLPKKAEWVLSVGNYANGFVLDKLADTQKEDTQDEEK